MGSLRTVAERYREAVKTEARQVTADGGVLLPLPKDFKRDESTITILAVGDEIISEKVYKISWLPNKLVYVSFKDPAPFLAKECSLTLVNTDDPIVVQTQLRGVLHEVGRQVAAVQKLLKKVRTQNDKIIHRQRKKQEKT